MIEINPSQQQQIEAQGSGLSEFLIPSFGPVKTSLLAPLFAIANTMFDSIKAEEVGNAKLAIGIDDKVQEMSDDKIKQVATLEKQLLSIYKAMPKYNTSKEKDKKYNKKFTNEKAKNQGSIQSPPKNRRFAIFPKYPLIVSKFPSFSKMDLGVRDR